MRSSRRRRASSPGQSSSHRRRAEVGRAEQLIDEVAEGAARATGWHGWLWRIRLGQARAEIALARRDWDPALGRTADSIEESRRRGRVKYEVLGLSTRARALHAPRTHARVDRDFAHRRGGG